MDKIAIIFVGLQGSGKTYFYNENFKEAYRHISLDELHTRNKEAIMLSECIAKGMNLVIDNTNPVKADRSRYIPLLKEAGYTIKGFYFESKLKDCIRRNNVREGKERVPEKAIAATSNKLELPSISEGFDELYYVSREDETKMIVKNWRES